MVNFSCVYLCGINIVLGSDGEALASVLLPQPVGEPSGLGIVEPLPDLSTVHHHRLKELGHGQQLNVSLEFAYERVTKGLKAKVSSSLCDRRAALIMELLERLLETPGSKRTQL